MASPQVRINGVNYYVYPQRNGTHVELTTTEQFIEAQSTVGGQTQEALRGRSTRTFGPWTGGFGRDRIPENKGGDPFELTRFWDSTSETRFPTDARIGLLNDACTGELASSRLRGSVMFDAKLWTAWAFVHTSGTTDTAEARSLSGTSLSGGGTIFTEGAGNDGFQVYALETDGAELLCLLNTFSTNGFYRIYRSTDGITWNAGATIGAADILSTASRRSTGRPTHALLTPRTIAGEVAIAVLDGGNSEIEFYSTTDSGATINDESLKVKGTSVFGMAVYPDIDGTDKVYVLTDQGLYMIDTAGTWTIDLILALPKAQTSIGMEVHQGMLWFPLQVSNDSPALIYAMEVAGDTRRFHVNMGLNIDDGVPSDMLGPVAWMESAGEFLYMAVGGWAASRQARILCHNGLGWHHMRQNGNADETYDWVAIGTSDDLYYAYHSSGADVVERLADANLTPQSGVSITRQTSSYIDLPEFDGGMATTPAVFLQQRINAADLSATNSGEYVDANYGVDGAVRTTDVASPNDFLSGTKTLKHASGAGVAGTSYAARMEFNRDGGTNTETPKVRSLEIVYRKIPTKLITANFTIDVAKQMHHGLLVPAKEVRTKLEAAEDLSTLVAFDYSNLGTKYVKVTLLRSQEELVQHSGGGEGAINAFWIRNGLIDVECEEIAG